MPLSLYDRQPHLWYPNARKKKRNVYLHMGPTNSGKTYHALKRLEACSSGITTFFSIISIKARRLHLVFDSMTVCMVPA